MNGKDEKIGQLVMDYQLTFGCPEGQRVLDDLKKLTTYKFSSFEKHSNLIDIHALIYDEAKREMILHIERKLEEKNKKQPDTAQTERESP